MRQSFKWISEKSLPGKDARLRFIEHSLMTNGLQTLIMPPHINENEHSGLLCFVSL